MARSNKGAGEGTRNYTSSGQENKRKVKEGQETGGGGGGGGVSTQGSV